MTKKRLIPQGAAKAQQIVKRFSRKPIGVIGDLMLDELIQGSAARISPEAPVPVVLVDERTRGKLYLGGAGNVVRNLASLGAQPIPFGIVGKDRTGHEVQRLLSEVCPNSETVIMESRWVTPRKTRIVAHQQQLLRIDNESPRPLSSSAMSRMEESLAKVLPRLKAIVISDYDKGTLTPGLISRILKLARQKGIPSFVDPKPENAKGCHGATLVAPNLQEAEQMTRLRIKNITSLERVGKTLRASLECSYLLVTRGGDGMSLFDPRGGVTHIAAETRPVYDVTGAGDTVIAALSLAYGSGATMFEAARLANLAGLIAVLKFGTAQVPRKELLRAIEQSGEHYWKKAGSRKNPLKR